MNQPTLLIGEPGQQYLLEAITTAGRPMKVVAEFQRTSGLKPSLDKLLLPRIFFVFFFFLLFILEKGNLTLFLFLFVPSFT
jgi:hypothetical protein